MSARTPATPRAKKEKFFVIVCLRPLSKKEQLAKDLVAWECQDHKTIVYKPRPHQRSPQPASFTFDKVFGPPCKTEAVYEEGVKNVALSSLMGINATVFAYGQTSSGKTYMMRGVMEKAVTDIYKHIIGTPEREFTIKISGLEIYNENVRDLLNLESGGNLKLLDDPEKGIKVEKLVEETAMDEQHLRHLISICEAQREVGETALNDKSSRSHQIIRLIIESTLRGNLDFRRPFVASLNFVDLAGSERASETHADGARLRQGCHINRSLMTLQNVIRKLSAGKVSGHIPYRDSKLTRILQHSLGGNARTAIICTLSPALRHVEQSRSTLLFASQAKEIRNNACVNMVVSDKQKVKNLERQVARLETELQTLFPSREKYLKSQQMKMEIEDLKNQRDYAQSQVKELRKKLQVSNPWELSYPFAKKSLSSSGLLSTEFDAKKLGGGDRARYTMMRLSSFAPFALRYEILKFEIPLEQLGKESNRYLELLQQGLACHRLGNQDAAETNSNLQTETIQRCAAISLQKEVEVGSRVSTSKTLIANLKHERLHSQDSTILNLEKQRECVQICIDKSMLPLPWYQKLALRCLEGLFGPRDFLGSLTHHSRARVDFFECCEDNNVQIMNEPVEHNSVPLLEYWQENEHSASAYGSQRKPIADGAEELADCHCETSGSDGHHNANIDISMESSDFSGFLCDKGGHLLMCNANNCHLVFHEKFLGSESIFYEKGKFYCPSCSYYLVHQNRHLGDREENFRRKATAFKIVSHQLTDDYIVNEPVNVGDEDGCACDNRCYGSQDGFQVQNQPVEVEEDEPKEGDYEHLMEETSFEDTHQVDVACSVQGKTNQVKGDEDGKRSENNDDNSEDKLQIQPESMGISETIILSDSSDTDESEDGGHLVRKKPTNYIVLSDSSDDMECHLARNKQFNKRGERTRDLHPQSRNSSSCQRSAVEEDANSQNEKSSTSSNHESTSSNLALPKGRRKRIYWTLVEEEKLKEGVERFATTGTKRIPWRKVLEIGHNVFHKDRISADLRNKWAQMTKAASFS